MFPTTPTLPTVIVTPCTPQYLLPTRHTSSPYSTAASSSRQHTRKQHLISALSYEFDPASCPSIPEKQGRPDNSLLLPPPINLSPSKSRRQPGGLVLSLLVFGLFGLILMGPMLPYRWWTGCTEAPAVMPELMLNGTAAGEAISGWVGSGDAAVLEKRWEAYGPGQGDGPDPTRAYGPGEGAAKRDGDEELA